MMPKYTCQKHKHTPASKMKPATNQEVFNTPAAARASRHRYSLETKTSKTPLTTLNQSQFFNAFCLITSVQIFVFGIKKN